MLNAVFSQPYPYRYPPLPEKQLGGLYYIRRHMYAPEVIPIVGIVLCSAGMGVYFSQGIGTTKKNNFQWQARIWPWLQSMTAQRYSNVIGGAGEMIQRELTNCMDSWNWGLMSLEQV
ncbi:hypothetical protein OPQ81_008538 [Rhizoctonia solani]|nr:hypothetical protein OPQ81_008538 [Rhizoctonia solani]